MKVQKKIFPNSNKKILKIPSNDQRTNSFNLIKIILTYFTFVWKKLLHGKYKHFYKKSYLEK